MKTRPPLTWLLLGALVQYAPGCTTEDSDGEGEDDDANGQDAGVDTPGNDTDDGALYAFEPVISSDSAAVEMLPAPDGGQRVFVVNQAGYILEYTGPSADAEQRTWLDISDGQVRFGGEMGLLGLAFHPDFASNGLIFVNYVSDLSPDGVSEPRLHTRISRFEVRNESGGIDPNGLPDRDSETIVLAIDQPAENHNGGEVAFGPDGYLYVGMGDGGGGGDPDGHAQNLNDLLGKMLRLDVDDPANGLYDIPADNPFVGQSGVREEIFAYGLRNPWRFSFDSQDSTLWLGDVGQGAFEEIDVIESGGNYGWNVMEGFACYTPSDCDSTGLELPVWDYPRDEGTTVVGGHVYRGTAIPELVGRYIFADYGSGRVWAVSYTPGQEADVELLLDSDYNITDIGIDADDELYAISGAGDVARLVSAQ